MIRYPRKGNCKSSANLLLDHCGPRLPEEIWLQEALVRALVPHSQEPVGVPQTHNSGTSWLKDCCNHIHECKLISYAVNAGEVWQSRMGLSRFFFWLLCRMHPGMSMKHWQSGRTLQIMACLGACGAIRLWPSSSRLCHSRCSSTSQKSSGSLSATAMSWTDHNQHLKAEASWSSSTRIAVSL